MQREKTNFLLDAISTPQQNIRNLIPWPVKSGRYEDVKRSEVVEFYQKTTGLVEMSVLRQEYKRWHPDRSLKIFKNETFGPEDKLILDMIASILNDFKERARN